MTPLLKDNSLLILDQFYSSDNCFSCTPHKKKCCKKYKKGGVYCKKCPKK